MIAALLTIYFVWGSTYLAIKVAIETIPPFLMAGVRMLIAGTLLYSFARLRGAPSPNMQEWKATTIVGAFLLLGGNGLVVWAAQKLPSGLLSLLVGATPISMILLGSVLGYEKAPGVATIAGLIVGFLGLAWLVYPAHNASGARVDLLSACAAFGATVSWAWGSHYARRAPLPASKMLAIAMEMITGGVLLVIVSVLAGELTAVHRGRISVASLAAVAYLVVFGSLVGFSVYMYLLEKTTPALATSYAFVNPIVAVILGWALRNEEIGPHVIGGGALIIVSVILITMERSRASTGGEDYEVS